MMRYTAYISRLALACLMMVVLSIAIDTQNAYAQNIGCCSCSNSVELAENTTRPLTETAIKEYFDTQMNGHQDFIEDFIWDDHILEALMMMGEQLSAVAIQQTQIIGSFFDARNQTKSQQTLQVINAKAHKDYHPSTGLCDFGSFSKSLAASERKNEVGVFANAQFAQDKDAKHGGMVSVRAQETDMPSRLNLFKSTFCDKRDHNGGLAGLCSTSSSSERLNKDVDFSRTFAWPWTLNTDYTNDTNTNHEVEIAALAENLYGFNTHKQMNPKALAGSNAEGINIEQEQYQNFRALNAKRAVAENSFNAILATKSEGTEGSRSYLLSTLKELGLDGPEAAKLLLSGGADNPSYYAQMEILTKKAYQNPDFYTKLYDTPENIKRKTVAMQGISMMQKFDLLKSHLRTEMNLSIMLELAVEDLQEEIENTVNKQKGGEQRAPST